MPLPVPLTFSQFVKRARKKHGRKYEYTEYVNSYTKITIICPKHGPFLQRPRDHLYGNGCPECGKFFKIRKYSKPSKLKSPKRTRKIHPNYKLLMGVMKRMKDGEFISIKQFASMFPEIRNISVSLLRSYKRLNSSHHIYIRRRGVQKLSKKSLPSEKKILDVLYRLEEPILLNEVKKKCGVSKTQILHTIYHLTRPFYIEAYFYKSKIWIRKNDLNNPPKPLPNTILYDLAFCRGAKNRFKPKPPLPTKAVPGSPEKILVLCERARVGEELFGEGDVGEPRLDGLEELN